MKSLILSIFLFSASCAAHREKRQIEEAIQEEYQSSQEIRAAYPESQEAFREFSR